MSNMMARSFSKSFLACLSICILAFLAGSAMLTSGLRDLEPFPATLILIGILVCTSAISGAAVSVCVWLVAKSIQTDILPSVVRLSSNMADLRSIFVEARAAAIAHSSGGENIEAYGVDEVLCILDGRPCRIYRDGQVDLETLGGTRRFASIEEARIFIGASGALRIEPLG